MFSLQSTDFFCSCHSQHLCHPYSKGDFDVDRSELESRIRDVTARILKIDAAEITPESNFIFDLGADSAQSVELVAAFEEEFEIEMDEDQALAVQTIGGAVDFIGNLVED